MIPSAPDVVIYDGLLKDCVGIGVDLTTSGKTTSMVYYRITVYTNGAEVGNEYAGESLTADFIWQAE